MAQHLSVSIEQHHASYPITIGSGLLSEAGALLTKQLPHIKRVMIVTDEHVAPLYLTPLQQALQEAGLSVSAWTIPPGETHKTIATAEQLYGQALAHGIKRSDTLLALGGGIVGDLTGFVAATFLRGVHFVQMPTTLLAQVDASIGGKVGVNWQQYKNLIGSFYHPACVLMDTQTLETLPLKEFSCGMAEVIKYSLLEHSIPDLNTKSSEPLYQRLRCSPNLAQDALEDVILTCCTMKATVVKHDPNETTGLRKILNLGHTFGHAYETLSKGAIAHGEAVSIGIMHACETAVHQQLFTEEDTQHIAELLTHHQLPLTAPSEFSAEQLIDVMRHDKKASGSSPFCFILPDGSPGHVRVDNTITEDLLHTVLTKK